MNATLPTLDQVSPAAAWQPWQPTPTDPWGRKWAAHLYRRAAFGPGREELLEGFQEHKIVIHQEEALEGCSGWEHGRRHGGSPGFDLLLFRP